MTRIQEQIPWTPSTDFSRLLKTISRLLNRPPKQRLVPGRTLCQIQTHALRVSPLLKIMHPIPQRLLLRRNTNNSIRIRPVSISNRTTGVLQPRMAPPNPHPTPNTLSPYNHCPSQIKPIFPTSSLPRQLRSRIRRQCLYDNLQLSIPCLTGWSCQ